MLKRICIICSEYPNPITPTNQVFVQQLVWALAETGLECTVICPLAINLNPSFIVAPNQTIETTKGGATISLYFPKFISFGQRTVAGIKTAKATTELFCRAVREVWDKLPAPPDLVYGHFLTPSGICASRISRNYKVPAFAVYGEDSPWSVFNFGKEDIKKEIASLTGIITVSSAGKEVLTALNLFPPNRIKAFPNGVRSSLFYPRDKAESRMRFGLDTSTFLVAYLGEFTQRKGILRVAEAVKDLVDVSVAFAGRGKLRPKVSNCVFNGVVRHEELPYFLSAADVFVLPTLSEGCCNAIIEAMACGLPVISSDLPFNADILDYKNSILVDPQNIQAIREAIIFLRDNPAICASMRTASLEKATLLTIERRASNILDWIKATITPSSVSALAK